MAREQVAVCGSAARLFVGHALAIEDQSEIERQKAGEDYQVHRNRSSSCFPPSCLERILLGEYTTFDAMRLSFCWPSAQCVWIQCACAGAVVECDGVFRRAALGT